MLIIYFILYILLNSVTKVNSKSILVRIHVDRIYSPTWDDLDSRKLPNWFNDAKFGIFVHWGLYSVPSFGEYSEWFWINWKSNNFPESNYMKTKYPPNFQYQDFTNDFTAEFFNPNNWANLFSNSGAKYVIFTSKHHDGFTMFPSKYSPNWNSVDMGPHRDIVGELSKSIRSINLKFGVYYSLYEWFNPFYLSDAKSNFTKRQFPTYKMIPEMKYLIETYKPEVFWADGDWEATDEYFQSREFIAWLYSFSSVKETVVINDRWGKHILGHHGDFITIKNPLNPHLKWESSVTLDKQSWGFRRDATLQNYLTIEELIKLFIQAISCGGNFLLNIGASKEGTIAPIMQERLLQIGEWLNYNNEAIYGSRSWVYQNEINSQVWYTYKNNTIYAICLQWPQNNEIQLKRIWMFVNLYTQISMLSIGQLQWKRNKASKTIKIKFPDKEIVKVQWSWILKIQN